MTTNNMEVVVEGENQLQTIIAASGLEPTKAEAMLKQFGDYFTIAADWERKAKTICVTDASQHADMAMARVGRLFLREKRIAVEKTRKELKEQSMREGKAIDGIANVLKAVIVPIEEYLEKQERFTEIKAAEEAARLAAEEAARIESERIAKERAEVEERERIRLKNIRLEQEAEEKERARIAEKEAARVERERMEAERRAIEEKARREQEEHERALAAEKARAEAERKAAEEKVRIEREAAEAKARAEREEAERKLATERAKAEAERKAAEEKARKEREAIEAKARAEREAAERKAKAEQEAKDREIAAVKEKAEAERKERERLEAIIAAMITCPQCGHKFNTNAAVDQAPQEDTAA